MLQQRPLVIEIELHHPERDASAYIGGEAGGAWHWSVWVDGELVDGSVAVTRPTAELAAQAALFRAVDSRR